MSEKSQEHLLAEYVLLEQYDLTRATLGHDYGNGARRGELIRRLRELEPNVLRLAPQVTKQELLAAYARVGKQRDRRAQADAAKYGSAGANRTATAWRRIRQYVGAA